MSQYGLRVNIKKTEYLETNSSDGSILVNGEGLTKMNSFKYPGSHLQIDGGINDDVCGRVNVAWKVLERSESNPSQVKDIQNGSTPSCAVKCWRSHKDVHAPMDCWCVSL